MNMTHPEQVINMLEPVMENEFHVSKNWKKNLKRVNKQRLHIGKVNNYNLKKVEIFCFIQNLEHGCNVHEQSGPDITTKEQKWKHSTLQCVEYIPLISLLFSVWRMEKDLSCWIFSTGSLLQRL